MALGGLEHGTEGEALTPVERARAIRRATALTHRERVVLLELSDMQGDNAECWPAQSTLSEYTGVDDRNLRRLFTKLAAEGWLTLGRTPQGLRSYAVTIPESGRAKTTLPSGSKQPECPGQNNPGQNNPPPGSKQPAPPGHPDPAPRVKTTLHGTNHELIMGTNHVAAAATAVLKAPSEAYDPLHYHPGHPVVAAGLGGWQSAWATQEPGKTYTRRSHTDALAMGRLAHWLERHCAANGGDPSALCARIASDFVTARWGARRPAMAWLDPDAPQYPFDPAAWLEGPPAARESGPKRIAVPAPPAEDHGEPTDAAAIDFSNPASWRIHA